MKTKEIKISNRLGLHARPSAKVTQLAGKFESEVWLSKAGQRVNAKSIMGVMMLAAAEGEVVLIETNGIDEEEALVSLTTLIENRFDEKE